MICYKSIPLLTTRQCRREHRGMVGKYGGVSVENDARAGVRGFLRCSLSRLQPCTAFDAFWSESIANHYYSSSHVESWRSTASLPNARVSTVLHIPRGYRRGKLVLVCACFCRMYRSGSMPGTPGLTCVSLCLHIEPHRTSSASR
jgi:hypothetical protein